jgi:3-hydroxy acid dehydrogenase/malonic semialdehyde reductase
MSDKHVHLAGKRILLTGGSTGIGRATLKLLAGSGARLLTFGRHEPEIADALSAAGLDEAAGLLADAGTRDGIDAVFAAVDERLGGLDILVANAALGAEPLHQMPEDDWRYVIETNLVGYLACARQAIPRLEQAGGGHLLFVGSIAADVKKQGESVYAATKGGIQAFSETLRKEVQQKNIKVSLIEPGAVGSDMQESSPGEQQEQIAQGEMLYAEEIAQVIAFTLTRSPRCDIVSLRVEPIIQKLA